MKPLTTAQFYRKAVSVAELPDSAAFTTGERIKVEKIIELSAEQYRYFTRFLLDDMSFIMRNKHLTGIDTQRVTHCLMVTTPESDSCVLVDTQGYDYARYTAYVSEKERIPVDGVPVEWLNLKERNTGEKEEPQKDRHLGQSR